MHGLHYTSRVKVVIPQSHQTEALLLPLLLSQQQRHLQGVFLPQTPLHALQHVCAPQVFICAQNKHTVKPFFFSISMFYFITSLPS